MKKGLFLFSFSLLLFTACSNIKEKAPSSKIYFWSDQDGQMQIYTMNPNGSNQQKISGFPDQELGYTQLSPNHQYLAVVREKERHFAIFILALDGKIIGTSSPNFDTYDDLPNWSPDSQYIAFVSRRDGLDSIYVMKYDGTQIKRLTNTPSQLQTCPVWSRDNKKIAFQFMKSPMIFDGYFMNADGSDIQRFGESTGGTGYYCPPVAWSPDSKLIGINGTEIVYLAAMYNNGFSTIHVVSPDLGYFTNTPPVWSPDGKRLLFTIDSHEPTHHTRDEIYTVGIDGTMLMNLTNNDSANDTNPIWSPDGQYIIFESNRDGDYEIYCMKPDGTELIQLSDNSTNDKIIDWK